MANIWHITKKQNNLKTQNTPNNVESLTMNKYEFVLVWKTLSSGADDPYMQTR